ncbi:GLPGLI family protein [Tenacibaculum sp.]|uniref:GLPGLI family protein n=1 Tax=Tenacibaculum sp. TaxID=1906242 RepID=UPI003AA8847D
MKAKVIYLITIIIFTYNYKVNSQNSNGIVTYTASLLKQNEINLDTLKASQKVKKGISELMSNKNTLEYQLKFNKNFSSFNKVDQLELNKKENILLKILVNSGTFYNDKKNDVTVNAYSSYGDLYLITYPKTNWLITNETKIISGYLCRKAITKKTNSKTKKEDIIIAWFTSEIPINYGPVHFSGLPGLILELEFTGKYRLNVKGIRMNIKEEKIKIPESGIKMTLEQYEKMLQKAFDYKKKKYSKYK